MVLKDYFGPERRKEGRFKLEIPTEKPFRLRFIAGPYEKSNGPLKVPLGRANL
jgi:hypothetical protein